MSAVSRPNPNTAPTEREPSKIDSGHSLRLARVDDVRVRTVENLENRNTVVHDDSVAIERPAPGAMCTVMQKVVQRNQLL